MARLIANREQCVRMRTDPEPRLGRTCNLGVGEGLYDLALEQPTGKAVLSLTPGFVECMNKGKLTTHQGVQGQSQKQTERDVSRELAVPTGCLQTMTKRDS